jgi:hypothetical protein
MSDVPVHEHRVGPISQAALVLAELWRRFTEGTSRFLSRVVQKLYLAGRLRLQSVACVLRCRAAVSPMNHTRHQLSP